MVPLSSCLREIIRIQRFSRRWSSGLLFRTHLDRCYGFICVFTVYEVCPSYDTDVFLCQQRTLILTSKTRQINRPSEVSSPSATAGSAGVQRCKPCYWLSETLPPDLSACSDTLGAHSETANHNRGGSLTANDNTGPTWCFLQMTCCSLLVLLVPVVFSSLLCVDLMWEVNVRGSDINYGQDHRQQTLVHLSYTDFLLFSAGQTRHLSLNVIFVWHLCLTFDWLFLIWLVGSVKLLKTLRLNLSKCRRCSELFLPYLFFDYLKCRNGPLLCCDLVCYLKI